MKHFPICLQHLSSGLAIYAFLRKISSLLYPFLRCVSLTTHTAMCPSERESSINNVSCGLIIILPPTVTVQRLECLIRMREVPGSILARRRTILRSFVLFLSPPRQILEKYSKSSHKHFLPHHFQFSIN